jgi:hypothetical protein
VIEVLNGLSSFFLRVEVAHVAVSSDGCLAVNSALKSRLVPCGPSTSFYIQRRIQVAEYFAHRFLRFCFDSRHRQLVAKLGMRRLLDEASEVFHGVGATTECSGQKVGSCFENRLHTSKL